MLYITKSTMWLSFWRSVVLSHSYVFLFFLLKIISLFLCFLISKLVTVILTAQMAPMLVRHAREVPEYEIDPKEIDFSNSVEITKVLFFFFVCFSLPSFVIENIQRITIIFAVCFVSWTWIIY